MADTIAEIASRISELRKLTEITAEEMAKRLEISSDTYSSYEDGSRDIPASVLFEIANKLDVNMSLLLTGEEPRMNIFTVTRNGEGAKVERREEYKYQNLAGNFIHKKAEPLIVVIEPHKEAPSVNSHPGQEFEYVLEGTIRLYIHKNEIILEEGDSVFFDSSYEHALEALNGRPAKILAVVM